MLEPKTDELLERIRWLAEIRSLEHAKRFWKRLAVGLGIAFLLFGVGAARLTTCLYQRIQAEEVAEQARQALLQQQEEDRASRAAQEQDRRLQKASEPRDLNRELVRKASQWLRNRGSARE